MDDGSNDRISVQDWWDTHHRGDHPDHRFFLTGSSGSKLWARLSVDDHLVPGRVVLNIGVGLGRCTRELAKRGCVIHALDVSPVALDKVRKITERAWLASELDELPASTFDVAISNLVTQHISNADLEKQLLAVCRSLKPNGIFAMQFAYRLNGISDHEDPVTNQSIKCGAVCRSLSAMVRKVEASGGIVCFSRRIGVFPEFGSGWYVLHIVRPEFPVASSVSHTPGLPQYLRRKLQLEATHWWRRLVSLVPKHR